MRSNQWRLSDVCVIGLVLLLMLAALPALRGLANETADRVKCAQNLRSIGQAILLYANENRYVYPRTISDINSTDKPVWGTPYSTDKTLGPVADSNPFADEKKPEFKYRPAPNDVTAALYQLIRTQDISIDTFICPSTRKKPWDFGGRQFNAVSWTNFGGNDVLRDHLSYSYANPYPSKKAISNGFKLNTSISNEFVVAGDMNPGGDGPMTVTQNSTVDERRPANSANHKREGQNFLYGDGHVEFQQTPLCGANGDNAYTFGREKSEGIVGSPVDGNDSVLLPTATDIGALDPRGKLIGFPEPVPFNDEEKRACIEKVKGTYISFTAPPLKGNEQRNGGPQMVVRQLVLDETTMTIPQADGSTESINFVPYGTLEGNTIFHLKSATGREEEVEVQSEYLGRFQFVKSELFSRLVPTTAASEGRYSALLQGKFTRVSELNDATKISPPSTLLVTADRIVMTVKGVVTSYHYSVQGRVSDHIVISLVEPDGKTLVVPIFVTVSSWNNTTSHALRGMWLRDE